MPGLFVQRDIIHSKVGVWGMMAAWKTQLRLLFESLFRIAIVVMFKPVGFFFGAICGEEFGGVEIRHVGCILAKNRARSKRK